MNRAAILSEPEWRARESRHRERIGPLVRAHLERRSRHEKHPVWDFLFDYYSFKPAHLLRWSPGLQVLEGDASSFAAWKEFRVDADGARLNIEKFPAQRLEALSATIELLRATQARPAFHGCLGLHEWAMVYKCDELRHEQAGLRLSAEEIARLIESQGVRCSHYDAFRFFTPDARPLNVLQPSFESRIGMEQPGCIHANMDLYKWSYKFWPWISSGLIADALEVTIQARELDMRASPYDLRFWGFEPICIETSEGRRQYQAAQREVARRAAPVRAQLIEALEELKQALAVVAA